MLRLWVAEPLVLAGDLARKVDIKVKVKGGGITGQAEAVRQAIAKGLVGFFESKELKEKFLSYDRSLLVYDPRRTEPHKPSRSKKGARRHKQRAKR
jgi:small subunit ribosomal protein S9